MLRMCKDVAHFTEDDSHARRGQTLCTQVHISLPERGIWHICPVYLDKNLCLDDFGPSGCFTIGADCKGVQR